MMTSNHLHISQEIEKLNWYHPHVDRHVAVSLLLQNGTEGTYMMRPSSKKGQFEYALSVRCKDSVKHFTIKIEANEIKFGHGQFKKMDDFVNHFANKPLLSGESGELVLLKMPYPRQVDEPEVYECVTLHAEFNVDDDDVTPPDFSVNSKEGFLTKLGGIFKTWKTRWFVLHKNELKYFKEKMDRHPVRVLDMNECVECAYEKNMYVEKQYIFRLVFDWRIFYLYAASEREMQEWVRLIQWRLKNKSTGASTRSQR